MRVGFLGRGWAFPVRLEAGSGRIAQVEEEQDIRESLLIILQTEPGERLMHPEFGAGLRAVLHGVNSAATRALVQHRVKQALIQWEPRIHVDRVLVKTRDQQPNLIDIDIGYTVRRSNTFYNLVYPFYVQEQR